MLFLALTESNTAHVFEVKDKMCFPKAVGVFPCANFVGKKSTDLNNRLFCVSFSFGTTCYLSRWCKNSSILFNKDIKRMLEGILRLPKVVI